MTTHGPVTVKGYLTSICAGQDIDLAGNWTTHEKFGKQFLAQSCTLRLPTSINGLKKYLGSGLIRGIGKVFAERIVNHFGETTLDIIDATPERLYEVEGLGEKKVTSIIEGWKTQKEVARIMVFLQEKGITPAYAIKIYRHYGTEALSVINENPFRLADEVWGIGFSTADTIAKQLGFAHNDPRRIAAGILFILSSATAQGHLYVEINKLAEKAVDLLTLSLEEGTLFNQALENLMGRSKIVRFEELGLVYVGLVIHYQTENALTRHLLRILHMPSFLNIDTRALYERLRVVKPGELELNEKQQRGIMATFSSKITVITGGPGTGKTTLVRKLLTLLDEEHISYKLAAPTGRAAKRLAESTGRFAATIHRMLEFNPANGQFIHNSENTLKTKFLIVDESSMIDLFLAYSLIQAVPSTAHIVFIGDSDQLPSVGPGNILKDLIESERLTCVRLTEIFRQARSSLIVVNAHKVNHGEFPVSSLPDTKKDFVFIEESTSQNLLARLKGLLGGELSQKGFANNDIQILAPMNRGPAGTQALNTFLQGLLNREPQPHLSFFGTQFKKGDRVMQIRNNYDKFVFNGDIGFITNLDPAEQTVVVSFGEREVEYTSADLDELVLAYATTIHKSQGSEYPVVIIPIFMSHFILLQKNLLYTAITRAQKLCILIGEPRAIAMAIHKKDAQKRVTFLKKMLQEAISENKGGI